MSVPLIGTTVSYSPPAWTPAAVKLIPSKRVHLAHTPTPIQPLRLPGLPDSCPVVYVKRDDCTGSIEMSGNKTRKLEFLLADAQAKGCDCVITAGGTQSNHCRCTTACARTVGLPTHLVLRDDFHETGGNFFLNQLFGAHITELDRQTYIKGGGFDPFMKKVQADLEKQGKKPYFIPVGGSSALGTWGYVRAFNEFVTEQMLPLEQQLGGEPFSDIICTTGSGSTLAGLGLAAKWWNDHPDHGKQRPFPLRVTGYGVCDSPDYFFDMTDTLAKQLFVSAEDAAAAASSAAADDGKKEDEKGEKKQREFSPMGDPRQWGSFEVKSARGLGYSKASVEELKFLNEVARTTGVVLDKTYTNKAFFQMTRDLASGDLKPKGKLLIVHTGGGASVFDCYQQILDCEPFQPDPQSPVGAPKGYQYRPRVLPHQEATKPNFE